MLTHQNDGQREETHRQTTEPLTDLTFSS